MNVSGKYISTKEMKECHGTIGRLTSISIEKYLAHLYNIPVQRAVHCHKTPHTDIPDDNGEMPDDLAEQPLVKTIVDKNVSNSSKLGNDIEGKFM